MIDTSEFLKLNFCVRKASSGALPLHWVMPDRMIFDHELLFIEEGELDITFEDRNHERITHRATKGDIILIPPKTVHSIKTLGGVRLKQPHLHLDFTYREDFSKVYINYEVLDESHEDYPLFRENEWEKLGLPLIIRPQTSTNEQIKQLLYDVINIHASTDKYKIFKIKNKVALIIELLIEENSGSATPCQETRYEQLYETVNIAIEQNVHGELNLKELASKLGYTQNYISRIYKEKYGITPTKRHQECKLNRAKEYLKQGNISVSEVADSLGYPTPCEFSRTFKRRFGYSPKEATKSGKENTDR